MCYDYVHLDLSDISAYRNHNVQLCKMQNHTHIRLKFEGSVYYLHYINRYVYVYDSVVNSILNWTFKIRKV